MPPRSPEDQIVRARKLYHTEVARHVAALREALIRHDENLKAHTLMTQCVPHFLWNDTGTQELVERTRVQTLHLFDLDALEAYYGDNPYELPFEEQYGGVFTVETADQMGRVNWLVSQLMESGGVDNLLDLGCNDGWMLAHLHGRGLVQRGAGVDLAVSSIGRARTRLPNFLWFQGTIEDCVQREGLAGSNFDAVTCFEVLEHVMDPVAVMRIARTVLRDGGAFYFSTPYGACEQGWLADSWDWDSVEPKGHVRATLPDDVQAWVDEAGFNYEKPLDIFVDVDNLMLVKVTK